MGKNLNQLKRSVNSVNKQTTYAAGIELTFYINAHSEADAMVEAEQIKKAVETFSKNNLKNPPVVVEVAGITELPF